MNSRTQATLLNRLRDGTDPLAWDEFFERYWPLIYGYARHRGCSEHTAEEVVQEVMLKVFRQRDVFQYDPERGRFRDWLAVLVRNQAAEHRRRPSERVKAKGGEPEIAIQEAEAGSDRPDAAWEAAFDQALLMRGSLGRLRREGPPGVRARKPARRRVAWAIALAAAASVAGLILLRQFYAGVPEQRKIAQDKKAPATLPTNDAVATRAAIPGADQPPTFWTYHQAARRSPEALDALLDEHAQQVAFSGSVLFPFSQSLSSQEETL